MSKSIGNLVSVRDALNDFSSDAIRLYFLSSHYRNPLIYEREAVVASEKGVERLRLALEQKGGEGEGIASLNAEPFEQKFIEVMDDDFNTAQALAILFELAREINRGAEQRMNIAELQHTLLKLAGILGLTFKEKTKPLLDPEIFISLLVSVRDDLRQNQQWQLADRIRKRLADSGITLEDAPQGTVWRYKR